MATHDTIVVGASAGGVEALTTLVRGLGLELPAAVLIVLHVAPDYPSFLPTILSRDARLPVAHAVDGEEITTGRVYVAPPDHHLIIERQHLRLVHGPKENLHRPSIDALFRSAARWAGPRTIGVVLTGARDDGAAGMRAIKQRGGITIVQDPAEAPFPSMPLSVMKRMKVDYSMPLSDIAPLLNKLSDQPTDPEGRYPVPENIEIEARIAQQDIESEELIASVEKIGKVSRLTCPDCNGALWEINDEDMLRFRCHVGHAYSTDSLTDGQGQMLEIALWSAVRTLEEQIMLAKRIIERARKGKQMRAVQMFEQRAKEAQEHSSAIRRLLLRGTKDGIAKQPIQDRNEEMSVS
jgi:two-component system chemotaxis response regulator CheB